MLYEIYFTCGENLPMMSSSISDVKWQPWPHSPRQNLHLQLELSQGTQFIIVTGLGDFVAHFDSTIP